MHISFTPDGRSLIKDGARDTGYQILTTNNAPGITGPRFWIEPVPPEAPELGVGFATVPDALRALADHLKTIKRA